MQLIAGLQYLGLNEKEARVYIALLQMGRGSAYGIAERAGLKKPTTYVVLGELMKKGLALKIPRTRKQLFAPKPPDELVNTAEEHLKAAKGIMPELMAMAEGKRPRVRAFYYEGVHGIRDALWYHLREMKGGELLGFYASVHDAPQEVIDIFFEYNDETKKQHIAMRGIVPDHPSLKHWRDTDPAYSRTMKIIPYEEYSANISIDVGDTFVRILAFKDLQGVVIENPDVARTVRQIFEMVWKGI